MVTVDRSVGQGIVVIVFTVVTDGHISVCEYRKKLYLLSDLHVLYVLSCTTHLFLFLLLLLLRFLLLLLLPVMSLTVIILTITPYVCIRNHLCAPKTLAVRPSLLPFQKWAWNQYRAEILLPFCTSGHELIKYWMEIHVSDQDNQQNSG